HLYLHSFPTRRSSDLCEYANHNAMGTPISMRIAAAAAASRAVKVSACQFISVGSQSRILSGFSAHRQTSGTAENGGPAVCSSMRSEEHTSELQSRFDL